MDQPRKINEGTLVPNYSFYKTKCPRMKKEQFVPYKLIVGIVSFLNYKIVATMSIITRRHNSIATIKR